MQLQVETQIYKKDAIKDGIVDAGTKADYYITYINPQTGIQVHSQYINPVVLDGNGQPPYGNYVQINGDDISMWRSNKKKMSLDDTYLTFYDGNGTANTNKLAQFGSDIKIYKPGTGLAVIDINDQGAYIDGSVQIGGRAQSEYLNSNIQIGGRNLFLKTRDYDNYNLFIASGDPITIIPSEPTDILNFPDVPAGSTDVCQAAICRERIPYLLIRDKPIIFSCYIKVANGVTTGWFPQLELYEAKEGGSRIGVTNRNETIVGTGEWVKITQERVVGDTTWNLSSTPANFSTCYVRLSFWKLYTQGYAAGFQVKEFKWEVGNKATDWTPAPEDIDVNKYITSIDTNNGIIIKAINSTTTDNQSTSNYLKLNTNGLEFFKNGKSIALYGDTARIGKTDGVAFYINNGSLQAYYMNGNTRTKYFEVTPNGINFGTNNTVATTSEIEGAVSTTAVKTQYCLHTSSSSAPTTGWQDTVPTWTTGKYIWTRIATTKTTIGNSQSTSYSTAVYDSALTDALSTANVASTAVGGAASTVTTTQQFGLSTSTSSAPSSWTDSAPTWETGKYVWTRYKIIKVTVGGDTTTTYTTGIYDKTVTDALSSANEAAKTATNHLKFDETNGLRIAQSTSDFTKPYVQITSTGNQQGIITKYDSTHYSWLSSDSLKIYSGHATYPLVSFGSSIIFYEPSSQTQAAVVDSNGINIKAGTIKLGSKTSLTDANNGVYIGSDGIALGVSSVFKVTSAGALTATSGTIGGWTISATDFWKKTSGDNNGSKYFCVGAGNIGTDNPTLGAATRVNNSWNYNFYVTGNGKLYATNAEIKGKIQADSGYIGYNATNKITIGENTTNASIYSGMNSLGSTANGFYIGTDGISIGGGKFKVTSAGVITATGLQITQSQVDGLSTALNGKAPSGAQNTALSYLYYKDATDGLYIAKSVTQGTAPTAYYVQIKSNGIDIVGSNTNYKTTISSDGMYVYAGNTTNANNAVAFFGSAARIGKAIAGKGNVITTDNGISLRVGERTLGSLYQNASYTPPESATTYDNALIMSAAQYLALESNGKIVFESDGDYSTSICAGEAQLYIESSVDPEFGGRVSAQLWGLSSEDDRTENSAFIDVYGGPNWDEDGTISGVGMGVLYDGDTEEIHGVWDYLKDRWLIGISGGANASNAGKICCPGINLNANSGGANVRILGPNVSNWPDYGLAKYSGSSKRYKEDIEDLTDDALDADRLYDLRVVQFKYREDYLDYGDQRYGKLVPGLIAEEVEEVYPIAVQYENEMVDDWEVKFIVPSMLKLIQEQKKQIDELEQRLEALERR